jgi:hypothetical protein
MLNECAVLCEREERETRGEREKRIVHVDGGKVFVERL